MFAVCASFGIGNLTQANSIATAIEDSFGISTWIGGCLLYTSSLLGVLSLGITKGLTITIIADGPDEEDAVNGLVNLVSSNFA